jgi:hypothetical protein
MRILTALDRPVDLSVSNTTLLALCVAIFLSAGFGPGLIAPLPFVAFVTFFGSMLFVAMSRRGFFSRRGGAGLPIRVVCSFALAVYCLGVGWMAGGIISGILFHGNR